MASRVSIVDFVHALFKSNVVDICKKGDGYVLSTRIGLDKAYEDGREIVYTFSVKGLSTGAQILEKLGVTTEPNRPYFKEGDKEQIAEALLKEIKARFPNWEEFLDDHVVFKKGGKGYSP